MDDARGHITEPQEWIDGLLREYSAVEDVDEALQNMGLKVRDLKHDLATVTADRDHWHDAWYRETCTVDALADRLEDVEVERDALRAAIDKAPHPYGCAAHVSKHDPRNWADELILDERLCDCWKRAALVGGDE